MGVNLLETSEAVRAVREITGNFFGAIGGLARTTAIGGRELINPDQREIHPLKTAHSTAQTAGHILLEALHFR